MMSGATSSYNVIWASFLWVTILELSFHRSIQNIPGSTHEPRAQIQMVPIPELHWMQVFKSSHASKFSISITVSRKSKETAAFGRFIKPLWTHPIISVKDLHGVGIPPCSSTPMPQPFTGPEWHNRPSRHGQATLHPGAGQNPGFLALLMGKACLLSM